MSTSYRRRHPGLNLGETSPEADQQAEPVIFGFWIFLMSDLVIFALLFATYSSAAVHGVAGGPGPSQISELGPAFIETMLLLGSSFTFGFAAIAMKHHDRRTPVLIWLGITGLLGLGFIGFEIHDFWKLVSDGHTPQTSSYLSSYFALVATHGLHVTAGLIWMTILVSQIMVFGLVPQIRLRIMRLALFWHMLDIVWIGIFTVVILFGKLI